MLVYNKIRYTTFIQTSENIANYQDFQVKNQHNFAQKLKQKRKKVEKQEETQTTHKTCKKRPKTAKLELKLVK